MKKNIFILIIISIFMYFFINKDTYVSNEIDVPYIVTNKVSIVKGRENIDDLIEVQSYHDFTLYVDMSGVNVNKKGLYYANVAAKTKNTMTSKIIEVEVLDKVVYLTFDDGPSLNTQKILNILDKYNIKATFFVTAENKAYDYMIQNAFKQGHTIGLHAYIHDYAYLYLSENNYFHDLENISKYVEERIGIKSEYIRFPGGSSNTVSKKYNSKIMSRLAKKVTEKGYIYYDWNISSGDAESIEVSSKDIIKNSTNISEDMDYIILLFHDSASKKTTVESLDAIIRYYKDRGYVFKNIDKGSYIYHQKILN